MGVGLEISTSDIIGNEVSQNRSGRHLINDDIVSTNGDIGSNVQSKLKSLVY